MFSILILLAGGKGPTGDTIQNQTRKTKTMNADKTYKVREIFTFHRHEIAIAGEVVEKL